MQLMCVLACSSKHLCIHIHLLFGANKHRLHKHSRGAICKNKRKWKFSLHSVRAQKGLHDMVEKSHIVIIIIIITYIIILTYIVIAMIHNQWEW